MSWPLRRPDFLPAAAWEAAQALRDRSPPLSPAEAGALARLVDGRRMGPVWRNLGNRAPAADSAAWRLLLDLFAQSVPGSAFRPKPLRQGLADAPPLLSKIAKQAQALASLLEELAALEQAHNLELPAMDLPTLLEQAGYDSNVWGASRVDLALELDGALPALLRELATETDDARAVPRLPHEAYALSQKSGLVPEWVRYVDASHRLYYAAHLPLGLRDLPDAELAAVGSAVLDLQVTREHVRKYRATAPPDLLDAPGVVFFPSRDDAP